MPPLAELNHLVTRFIRLARWRGLRELLMDLIAGGTMVTTGLPGDPDVVVAQSTIQLDGDIVTKVNMKRLAGHDVASVLDSHVHDVETHIQCLVEVMEQVRLVPYALAVPSLGATFITLTNALSASVGGADVVAVIKLVLYPLTGVLVAGASCCFPRILVYLARKRLTDVVHNHKKHDPDLHREYLREAQLPVSAAGRA